MSFGKETIRITPEGSAWVAEQLAKQNIPPEVLRELGTQIENLLEEYRQDPLGTVIGVRWEEEHGRVREIVERFLENLGLK